MTEKEPTPDEIKLIVLIRAIKQTTGYGEVKASVINGKLTNMKQTFSHDNE